MINPSELWIGDLLLLKKSNRIGKFEGIIDNQKIKVKVDDKIIISKLSNIEIAPKMTESLKTLTEMVETDAPFRVFEPIIDLHIDVLNPSLARALPERIIMFQVNAAKAFIEEAIERNIYKIEIIHGKGAGVLKSEILHMLTLYEEITFKFDKNQGGSTEVWLS